MDYEMAIIQRLQAEVDYIKFFYGKAAEYGFDESIKRWWVYVEDFELPAGWKQTFTPILVTTSQYYPSDPPDGFFLSNELCDIYDRKPSHYFEEKSAHNSLSHKNWAWYCIHPDWNPGYDIRDGDSIAKYLTLIHLTLSEAIR
ncbi:MAG: E2/UBC family protein [Candidatus Eremiobacterota bacterium]